MKIFVKSMIIFLLLIQYLYKHAGMQKLFVISKLFGNEVQRH